MKATIIVHSLQPIAVAAIAYVLSEIRRRPWLSFIPIVVVVVIFYRNICIQRKKSLSRKSRVFNSQQTGDQQVKYTRRSTIAKTNTSHSNPSLIPSVKQEEDKCVEMRAVQPAVEPCEDPQPPPTVDSGVGAVYESLQMVASEDVEAGLYHTPLGEIFCDLEALSEEKSASVSNEQVRQLSRKFSSKSRSRSRRQYRGMYSLPDDDMSETSSRSFHQQKSGKMKKSKFLSQKTFSRILRMISFENPQKEDRDYEDEEEDDDDSFFDSYSSGSRNSYGSESSV